MMRNQNVSLRHSHTPNAARGRYDTLNLISWWQQEKVSKAKVMVVGAGALGNEILKNLALVGIGHILIIDFDIIEAANLTRSVLFRAEDIGKLKAEVAAQRLKELNPDVKVAQRAGISIRYSSRTNEVRCPELNISSRHVSGSRGYVGPRVHLTSGGSIRSAGGGGDYSSGSSSSGSSTRGSSSSSKASNSGSKSSGSSGKGGVVKKK